MEVGKLIETGYFTLYLESLQIYTDAQVYDAYNMVENEQENNLCQQIENVGKGLYGTYFVSNRVFSNY